MVIISLPLVQLLSSHSFCIITHPVIYGSYLKHLKGCIALFNCDTQTAYSSARGHSVMCHTTKECDNTWIPAMGKECVLEVLRRKSE